MWLKALLFLLISVAGVYMLMRAYVGEQVIRFWHQIAEEELERRWLRQGGWRARVIRRQYAVERLRRMKERGRR
jgi:hypothetical protein